jgi:hypothetical protein
MKYLQMFIEKKNSETYSELPTKPTKPRFEVSEHEKKFCKPKVNTRQNRQNPPASTCARIALADPTPAQIQAMDATSEADALELVQRLEAEGVRFLLNATPGVWRFDSEKICVEYERIARDDWHDVMKLRADIARHVATRRDAKPNGIHNGGEL